MYTMLAWSPCVGHFYLLRAAMIMANIDSVFDFMTVYITKREGQHHSVFSE